MASPVVDVKSPVRSPVTDWRPVPAALADHQPADSPAARLAAFFRAKGIFAIKQEDQREQWYDDWLVYQTRHQLYAGVLSPNKYSTLGNDFNLLRLARFVELFAYFSPGHAYSLQVTFLGLFSILMGTNEALKHEAVEALEAGGLLAFAISEKSHGADLFGNEFTLREMAAVPPVSPVRFRANGSKYYIGNANAAAIVSILARKEESPHNGRSRRAPFALFALRPPKTAEGSAYGDVKKIRTLGVRAAFVGEFTVTDHELSADDIIVEGRAAWDAVFGTVTLGKFFLGFGAIGICEHAFAEAVGHLSRRLLYGKPVIDMPHIRATMSQALARLTAMKLYAFRALDYLQTATANDRRYLLFNAVQKAKVSTEGVKVMALLSECIGAKGFEADSYFEMALRDIQLIPGLEGSTHLNFLMTAQFAAQYFADGKLAVPAAPSLLAEEITPSENDYLMQARTGGINAVVFPDSLLAYQPLLAIPNVRLFLNQIMTLRPVLRGLEKSDRADSPLPLLAGQCLAIATYAQLVAENATILQIPPAMTSAIFHTIILDLNTLALTLAAHPEIDPTRRAALRNLIEVPQTTADDWNQVAEDLRIE